MNPNPPIRTTRTTPRRCHRAPDLGKVLVAILLAALSGCAAETKVLRADAHLTPASLRTGGLAVVGVVEKEEVEQVRPPLIAALESVLRQERPDLPLVPADSVRAALGAAAYRRLLNGYQSVGVIDSASARAVGVALRGAARYGVLARVVSDVTRTSRRAIDPGDSAGYRLYSAVLVMGRDARVAIQLYDLAAGAAVYDAQFVGSSEASRYGFGAPVAPSPRSGTTIDVGGRPRPGNEGFPEPPELARALEEAYRNFARNLPRLGG